MVDVLTASCGSCSLLFFVQSELGRMQRSQWSGIQAPKRVLRQRQLTEFVVNNQESLKAGRGQAWKGGEEWGAVWASPESLVHAVLRIGLKQVLASAEGCTVLDPYADS